MVRLKRGVCNPYIPGGVNDFTGCGHPAVAAIHADERANSSSYRGSRASACAGPSPARGAPAGDPDKPDPEIDRAWAEECERRLDSYLRGETTALDAEEVLAKYLKP
jgi:Putative addiction module component